MGGAFANDPGNIDVENCNCEMGQKSFSKLGLLTVIFEIPFSTPSANATIASFFVVRLNSDYWYFV